MKLEEQRIAIAEACGLIVTDTGVCFKDEQECLLPDYLNDLNAMHEAVKLQPETVVKAMRYYLFSMCGQMKAHEATASQRAEAFLRTIGKWKE